MQSILFYLVIIPSAIIHEYSHGWMADKLGDPTARYAGRLTLDPRVHVDKWGTFLLPALLYLMTGGRFLFAYAKPVPYNPYNLKNQKWGPSLVALAGPVSNLILAAIFGLIIRYIGYSNSLSVMLSVVVYANVLLAVFNLVPIPPLDGSKILFAVLPASMWKVRQTLEQYGFFILLIFVFFFFQVITPIIQYLYMLFIGGGSLF